MTSVAQPPLEALRLNVLYVDDDAINLRVVSELLGAVGARVTTASDGRQGIEFMRAQTFDVVLLDIHMPQLSGPATLKLMRELPGAASIPTLALTADLSRDERGYAALGFDGFVAKPVSLQRLLAAILSALQSRAPVAKAQRA